jgi:hypothetical protein
MHPAKARDSGGVQVADVFESAEKLGLKVVRMWAFTSTSTS